MPTLVTRDPPVEIEELEALWSASPAFPVPAPQRALRLLRLPGPVLAAAWVAYLAVSFALAPGSDPNAVVPMWVEGLAAVSLLSLVGAGFLGFASPRFGFAASTVAGASMIALAYECRATGHHLGSWWLVELAGAAALAAAGTVGLASRLRRQ